MPGRHVRLESDTTRDERDRGCDHRRSQHRADNSHWNVIDARLQTERPGRLHESDTRTSRRRNISQKPSSFARDVACILVTSATVACATLVPSVCCTPKPSSTRPFANTSLTLRYHFSDTAARCSSFSTRGSRRRSSILANTPDRWLARACCHNGDPR